MKETLVPKGERTRVLYIWGSSVPGPVCFSAETKSGNPPAGTVETTIRRWLQFTTTEYPLQGENAFTKGMMDASYQIFVTPDEDTVVRFQTRHFRAGYLILALAVLIGLAVVAGTLPLLLQGP